MDDERNKEKIFFKSRWKIEECFRIMKTDFETRPVYVKRKDRIPAHFMTCFIALIVYQYLEQTLGEKYTIDQLLSTLREMDFMKYERKGYQPVYIRTKPTDALHDAFGFCTSKQIIPVSKTKIFAHRQKTDSVTCNRKIEKYLYTATFYLPVPI